jgi:hypothetical protein
MVPSGPPPSRAAIHPPSQPPRQHQPPPPPLRQPPPQRFSPAADMCDGKAWIDADILEAKMALALGSRVG